MGLTWRDVITTLLTAGIIVVGVGAITNWNVPILNNYRLVSLLIILAGIGMCILSGYTPESIPGPYSTIMGVLGGAIIIAGGLGLIFGTTLFVITAAGLVALMWLITTLRHMFS